MAFTLIVKGDIVQAAQALAAHGFTDVNVHPHLRFNECICIVHHHFANDWERLTAWFHDSAGEAPFPAGTLLWFGPRSGTEED